MGWLKSNTMAFLYPLGNKIKLFLLVLTNYIFFNPVKCILKKVQILAIYMFSINQQPPMQIYLIMVLLQMLESVDTNLLLLNQASA